MKKNSQEGPGGVNAECLVYYVTIVMIRMYYVYNNSHPGWSTGDISA